MSREQGNEPPRRLQNPAMFIVREHLKVLIGAGLTWAGVFISYCGLAHATLDGQAFVFPVFQPGNLLVLLSAPMAQTAFYILARKTSWLLKIYLLVSVLCCVIGLLHLMSGGGFRGYRFTYWHQGDLLCVQGCRDIWIFGYLVLVQGCILMFSSSAFEGLWDVWPVLMRFLLVAVVSWLFLTSCALAISM